MKKDFLPLRRAAEEVGLNYKQLLLAVKEGLVPHYKLRQGRTLVRVSELIAAMNPSYKKGGN